MTSSLCEDVLLMPVIASEVRQSCKVCKDRHMFFGVTCDAMFGMTCDDTCFDWLFLIDRHENCVLSKDLSKN